MGGAFASSTVDRFFGAFAIVGDTVTGANARLRRRGIGDLADHHQAAACHKAVGREPVWRRGRDALGAHFLPRV